jgi:hypothetical protein
MVTATTTAIASSSRHRDGASLALIRVPKSLNCIIYWAMQRAFRRERLTPAGTDASRRGRRRRGPKPLSGPGRSRHGQEIIQGGVEWL